MGAAPIICRFSLGQLTCQLSGSSQSNPLVEFKPKNRFAVHFYQIHIISIFRVDEKM
jgi:hypothetical protein